MKNEDLNVEWIRKLSDACCNERNNKITGRPILNDGELALTTKSFSRWEWGLSQPRLTELLPPQ